MPLTLTERILGDSHGGIWQRLRLQAADAVETVFGADPGLLRLRAATRTVISAAATLAALLLLYGSNGMQAAAPIALGFMVSNFANTTVRDPGPRQQAITLALLTIPALACVVLASLLSPWRWAANLAFVAVVTGAALARMAGPRGNAIGMVAFISYFIGEITRPPLTDLPQLVIAVVLAIGATAVTRFGLLPDRPEAALHRVKLHVDRRIGRILAEVDDVLAARGAELAPARDEARRHRMYRELARLNDALLIAESQIQSLGLPPDRPSAWEPFFAVELAAERLIRMAPDQRQAPGLLRARARIRNLRIRLARGIAPRPAPTSRATGELSAAVDELQTSLARLAEVWAKMRGPAAPPFDPSAPDTKKSRA
jgi:hypothetical protein